LRTTPSRSSSSRSPDSDYGRWSDSNGSSRRDPPIREKVSLRAAIAVRAPQSDKPSRLAFALLRQGPRWRWRHNEVRSRRAQTKVLCIRDLSSSVTMFGLKRYKRARFESCGVDQFDHDDGAWNNATGQHQSRWPGTISNTRATSKTSQLLGRCRYRP
jgi:hypothetical protein